MHRTWGFHQIKTHRVTVFAAFATIAFILISIGTTRPSSACPMPPTPLRTLYINSELVVVARIGKSIPVDMFERGEEDTFKQYLMRTELRVASTVKGVGDQAVVHVYGPGWSQEGEIRHSFGGNPDGETYLVFLTRRENGDGYEVLDNSNGIKRLSGADLEIYLARLNELDLIMRAEKPDPARIAEWLVRCVEEPATRRDGLYELTLSSYALRNLNATEVSVNEVKADEESKASGTNETAEANHASNDSAVENTEASSGEGDANSEVNSQPIIELPNIRMGYFAAIDPDFFRLLNEDQKRRLAKVLFEAKPLTYGELPIIELVKEWKNSRLVPFVISQLRNFLDDPPYEAQQLITFLAETLKDEELTRLATQYGEAASYSDREEDVIDEEVSEDESDGAEESAETTEEESDEPAAETAPEEVNVVGNDKQKRSIRLQRILDRIEILTSN